MLRPSAGVFQFTPVLYQKPKKVKVSGYIDGAQGIENAFFNNDYAIVNVSSGCYSFSISENNKKG
jgi:hypothetical protein